MQGIGVPKNITKAIDYLNQTITADSEYASASYNGLAYIYLNDIEL